MIERGALGSIRLLRLAHGKASALDLEFLLALDSELEAAERDGVPALVLTGTGGIFSAGVDLIRLRDGGAAYVREFLPALSRCFERLFFLPRPTVAAVNGHAIAGGGVLTLACDRRVMSRGPGRIGLPELKVGVPFPPLVIEIIRATLAPDVAQEIVLAGATYDPDAAAARCLVDEVVAAEGLLERARTIAEALAAVPPGSYRLSKELLRRPAREAYRRHGAAEDAATVSAWTSPAVLGAVREYVARTLGK
jgi:enoyl-CoA hydratase